VAAIYAVAAFLVMFSYAATIEADNPAVFPGMHDNDGAVVALFCVGLAVLFAAVAVTLSRRRLLSKIVCAAIVLVCVYRAISVSGQF
jgi:amino acid permease